MYVVLKWQEWVTYNCLLGGLTRIKLTGFLKHMSNCPTFGAMLSVSAG